MSVVDGLPFADEKKKYILDTLDPILEEMVSDVLTEMPKSPPEYMISWLRRRCGTHTSSVSIVKQNEQLKRELKKITGSLEEAGTMMTESAKAEPPEEDEEEEEDDEMDEIPESMKKPEAQMGRARQSVSAEAYGNWNQKKEFTPPKHPKSDEQKARVLTSLGRSFMFSCLDEKDMNTVVDATFEQRFTAGTTVINEGENGNYLFVIEVGSLDCVKEGKTVKTCMPGDVFGELALLYNCPRAATVVAKEDCICWQLDRETFTHIVKDAAVKQRQRYDDFLKSVALLSSVDAYERSQIADALVPQMFNRGETVIKQDEPGDKFYIIEEGTLFAMKQITGEGEKRVMDYQPGDCFGELALLKNQPRAASVVVESDKAKVLSMTRQSFNKMLGPLSDILSRQMAAYT